MTRPHARAIRRAARAAPALIVGLLAALPVRAGEITVFAAASLKTALEEAADLWTGETGHHARLSFAGSSAIARQIQQGAPADVFVSANAAWMDVLEADGLIDTATRRDLLGNRLVLAAFGEVPAVDLASGADLAARLRPGRIAMALVDAVPAGIYGKAALQRLGAWEALAPRVVQTDNVRAALALVALGEARYGIVYATDAAASDDVTVAGVFPAGSHPPIVYPAAAVAGAGPLAAAFLDYLAGPTARTVFAGHGFLAVP